MLRSLTIPALSAVALLAVGGISAEAFAKDKAIHEMKESAEVATCKKDPATAHGAALKKCIEDKKFEATGTKK